MVYVEASIRRPQLVAAAVRALCRDGVARTSLRAVAAEAGVPLGTLQHVFPSKELLFRAVVEDTIEQSAELLKLTDSATGLAQALRRAMNSFWDSFVAGRRDFFLMQYELMAYALRTPGQEDLNRWQYERYYDIIEEWTRRAAETAGEVCAIGFGQLARIIVAALDGLILQYLSDSDDARSRDDLAIVIDMLVAAANPR